MFGMYYNYKTTTTITSLDPDEVLNPKKKIFEQLMVIKIPAVWYMYVS